MCSLDRNPYLEHMTQLAHLSRGLGKAGVNQARERWCRIRKTAPIGPVPPLFAGAERPAGCQPSGGDCCGGNPSCSTTPQSEVWVKRCHEDKKELEIRSVREEGRGLAREGRYSCCEGRRGRHFYTGFCLRTAFVPGDACCKLGFQRLLPQTIVA